jgi:putative two-component system response regulator
MTVPREKILLVDDEEAIRHILNKGLQMHGFSCDEAESADQAIKKLESNPSDLVIMDINMPGKRGSEVLPTLTQRFPETAVIMASGITDTKIIAQCIKNGAQDYISKPFRFDQVLQSVNGTLDKRRLEMEIQRYFQDIKGRAKEANMDPRKLFLGAIQTLINTLEAGDRYTKGHSQEVAEIAASIGEELRLSAQELEDLHWASLLHDVGKIAVDPEILNKPGELTPSEYRHIMTHAVIGPNLVKPFVTENVVSIISHHHDYFDGGRHNQTIKGEEIPLGARIIAVADAYQAMTSDRPYRRALSIMDALEELDWCSGSQFDPMVANIMIRLIQEKQIEHSLESPI